MYLARWCEVARIWRWHIVRVGPRRSTSPTLQPTLPRCAAGAIFFYKHVGLHARLAREVPFGRVWQPVRVRAWGTQRPPSNGAFPATVYIYIYPNAQSEGREAFGSEWQAALQVRARGRNAAANARGRRASRRVPKAPCAIPTAVPSQVRSPLRCIWLRQLCVEIAGRACYTYLLSAACGVDRGRDASREVSG